MPLDCRPRISAPTVGTARTSTGCEPGSFQEILQARELCCRLTGQRSRLDFVRERQWYELLSLCESPKTPIEAVIWNGQNEFMLGETQTRHALISGCQPSAKDGTFLQVAGAATHAVTLASNDLGGVAKAALIGREVPRKAVRVK